MVKKNLLIIGAGLGSKLLMKELNKKDFLNYNLLGFLDDFKQKKTLFLGKPILGNIDELPSILSSKSIHEVIVAIPSLGEVKLKKIISLCETKNIETKILPPSYISLYSLKTGRPWIGSLRPVNLEDLLRRPLINTDLTTIQNIISGKTILVTGGGGSIGRELCNQLVHLEPKKLIIIDQCEFNLYQIGKDLENIKGHINLELCLGDVKDTAFLDNLFSRQKINIIFHAAAYKHVPLLENNIIAAVKNNIFGTYNLANMAEKYFVEKFIFISTDKAVNPKSIMGCTKKISEMLLQLFDKKTNFVTVRFGNVLGSAGSVIPLFEEQIKKGGPITITHPEIKRYFMTIPEAVHLVIHAGAIGKDKDILILDMGQQYKVVEIAKSLVKLHGLEPEKDIQFIYTGLRPGEKLFEELWNEKEKLEKTKNERIFTCNSLMVNKEELQRQLEDLREKLKEDNLSEIKKKLSEMTPEALLSEENSDKLISIKKLKVFITGGNGFIGTHLKERLDNEGISYSCSPPSNIIDLSDSKSTEYIGDKDVIIHLASSLPQKGVQDFTKDIEMTKNLVEYCKKNKVRLIFASSSAVYGEQTKTPLKEDLEPIPMNPYGKSKLECEKIIKESGICGVILRIFNVYGIGQKTPFFIPSLFENLQKGEIQLSRGIKRDFVHVRDVVEAILSAMAHTGKEVEIVNIGFGEEYSLEEVLGVLLEETGEKVKISYLPSNAPYTIRHSSANISKALNLLNWKPKISLEEGLTQIIAREYLNNRKTE